MPAIPRPLSACLALLLLVTAPLTAQDTSAAEATAEVEAVLDDATVQAIIQQGTMKSEVMRILEDLTGKVGHRLTGSDNFTKACDWAVGEFEEMGLQNVHKAKWGEWKMAWNRGDWSGRIVQPIPRRSRSRAGVVVEQVQLVSQQRWIVLVQEALSGLFWRCPRRAGKPGLAALDDPVDGAKPR